MISDNSNGKYNSYQPAYTYRSKTPANNFFAKPHLFVILFVSLNLHLLSDTKQYIPKCNGIIVFTDTWVELMRFFIFAVGLQFIKNG